MVSFTARVGPVATENGALLHVGATDEVYNRGITIDLASNSKFPLVRFRRSRGTLTGKTVPASGDVVGYLAFQGWDGANWVNAASVKAEVDGQTGSLDMPGRIVFQTMPDGYNQPLTERMRITSGGYVGIRTTTPEVSLHVGDGALKIGTKLVADATGSYYA